MKLYQIRDSKTGLYSMGGYFPAFKQIGKSYNSLKEVSLHLKLYCRGQYKGEKKKIPVSWEVVEFEMKEIQSIKATDIK